MKKIKKNQIIITALAIVIAIAGYINYSGDLKDIISFKKTEDSKQVSAENVNVAENANAQTDSQTNTQVNENTSKNEVDENEIVSNDAEPDPDSLTEPGNAVLTSGTGVSSSVISQAKLNREQIRAKNKESLLSVINNETLTEAAKTKAVEQLASITDCSEKEIAAELMLEAKGFSDVAVSMVDGNVDVVVNKASLTDTEHAQIEDIVKRKTQVGADKITINVCNN